MVCLRPPFFCRLTNSERVKVSGFGIFILFLYPGAFAEFKEEFSGLGWLSQLKIYCAGSWHNVTLAAISYLCLMSLPLTMFPLYSTPGGIVVTQIESDSVMHGSIRQFDVITKVGTCGDRFLTRAFDPPRSVQSERVAGVLRLPHERGIKVRWVLCSQGCDSRYGPDSVGH